MACTSWQHHDHLPLSLPLSLPFPISRLSLSLSPLFSPSLWCRQVLLRICTAVVSSKLMALAVWNFTEWDVPRRVDSNHISNWGIFKEHQTSVHLLLSKCAARMDQHECCCICIHFMVRPFRLIKALSYLERTSSEKLLANSSVMLPAGRMQFWMQVGDACTLSAPYLPVQLREMGFKTAPVDNVHS